MDEAFEAFWGRSKQQAPQLVSQQRVVQEQSNAPQSGELFTVIYRQVYNPHIGQWTLRKKYVPAGRVQPGTVGEPVSLPQQEQVQQVVERDMFGLPVVRTIHQPQQAMQQQQVMQQQTQQRQVPFSWKAVPYMEPMRRKEFIKYQTALAGAKRAEASYLKAKSQHSQYKPIIGAAKGAIGAIKTTKRYFGIEQRAARLASRAEAVTSRAKSIQQIAEKKQEIKAYKTENPPFYSTAARAKRLEEKKRALEQKVIAQRNIESSKQDISALKAESCGALCKLKKRLGK